MGTGYGGVANAGSSTIKLYATQTYGNHTSYATMTEIANYPVVSITWDANRNITALENEANDYLIHNLKVGINIYALKISNPDLDQFIQVSNTIICRI